MILRVRKHSSGDFVILARETLLDKTLSLKARGLWAYLMTFPDSWEARPKHIANQSDVDGITAIRSALKELEQAGLARLVSVQGDDGKLQGKRWDIFESVTLSETEMQETSLSVRDTGFTKVGSTETRETDANTRIIEEDSSIQDYEREGSIHPATLIYVEKTGIDPPLYFRDLIEHHVGIAPDRLEHWAAVCETWVSTSAWNEAQAKKMVDDFLKQREEPTRPFRRNDETPQRHEDEPSPLDAFMKKDD
jgi:hypothetical protein